MATLYTDLAALQATPHAKNRSDAITTGTHVHAKYTMAGTEGTADTIYVCKIPQGARVIGYLSRVLSSGVAGTATLNIGDDDESTADVDRYASALDVAAAGTDTFDENEYTAVASAGGAWMTAAFATLSGATAATTLDFDITFDLPNG